ncbi:MAG: Asp-tRNA(Asn)/Glu-tRNA(Gln) amidotransferase subunit GatA [Lachnospiraceae bacterium]|nr:Asp-tRNA(Asn)/Glu-tRNA(Gln) amidotransferase subunit GatA [Lachnospiraceae bacterium]
MKLTGLTAVELGRRIKSGEIGVREAVEAQLDAISAKEDKYHCYITVLREEALARADEVQKGIREGRYTSPLAGVPVAVKDNICMRGVRTTCASKMLEEFRPPYSAAVVEKLEAAGTVILGKTNMDEFAMGSTTETSFFGETKNPWDITRVPGGSSGGAAAAVAAGEAFAALGSDTGGSIRQPSAFCGVTGIKPTYGTVSRYGLIAYASSLDQIGPIARNVEDCAALLELIAGRDERDSTSVTREGPAFGSALSGGVRGMRIGIPRGYFSGGLDAEVKDAVLAAAGVLQEQGAEVEESELEAVDYAIPAYYVIASAEAGSNLSRYDGVKYGYRAPGCGGLQEVYKKTRSEGFGEEVRRRMLIGAFVLSSGYYDAYYGKAMKVREVIRQGFDRAFERYDMLLGPTAPTTAPKLGASLGDPLKMYLGDIYTVAVNLAGLPAISLPCGRDRAGLPIGLQLIGRPFGERELIRAARSFEQTRQWRLPAAGCISDGRGGAAEREAV